METGLFFRRLEIANNITSAVMGNAQFRDNPHCGTIVPPVKKQQDNIVASVEEEAKEQAPRRGKYVLKTIKSTLKEIFDPPNLLYAQGRFLPQDSMAIAIVGSRHATTYGKKVASQLARGLVMAGFTIVYQHSRA